jgi:serine/threonine protein kinase
MLSGAAPFQGESPREILAALVQEPPPDLRETRADVPDALAILVKRMLSKDPSARPPSAAAVARNLEAILSARVVLPADLAALTRRRWLRRIGFYFLGLLSLLLGAGLGFFLLHTGKMAGEKSARLQSVRKIISEGMDLLRAGKLREALLKQRELEKFQGAPEDWELLGPEIRTFERALQMASRKIKE